MALCTHMLAIMLGYVCVAASSPFRLKWGDCRNHWQKFWAKVLVKYRYTVLRLLTKYFCRPLVKIACQLCKFCIPLPLAKFPCQSLSKIQVYCIEASDEGFQPDFSCTRPEHGLSFTYQIWCAAFANTVL